MTAFSNLTSKKNLLHMNYTQYCHQSLKLKKSVIIPRVDDVIYERSLDDIGEEIMRMNSWIGDELESTFKFPKSPTLKLTFTETQLAKMCTEVGLKAFNISIPSHEIKLETYIPIK